MRNRKQEFCEFKHLLQFLEVVHRFIFLTAERILDIKIVGKFSIFKSLIFLFGYSK